MNEQIADWAILVYMSADRVLANFAVESLRQLKRGAGLGVIVLAQQASGNEDAQRYIFDEASEPDQDTDMTPSIEKNRVNGIAPALTPGGIADPRNLTEFIKWASQYQAKHRCLFLWGHGYELLLNDDLASGQNASVGDTARAPRERADRKYLAPKSLKKALEDAKPFVGKLDIIGIDACSLSLVELATELADCGKFLIASQEDVPDTSFPYEQLLRSIQHRDNRDDVEGISAAIPGLYAQSYQDYIVATDAGMRGITLTSLRLGNMAGITEPLAGLAVSLQWAAFDHASRKSVVAARKASRDFALGLFVDLRDFCAQLSQRLEECELQSACEAVYKAIDARGNHACILENTTRDNHKKGCHGLSIYFPYLTDGAKIQMQSLVASGNQWPVLLKGGTNHLEKARGGQIAEIEEDFELLGKFKKTNWVEFIKRGWAVMLAAEERNELDRHYSAQQCAINLYAMLSDWKTPQPPQVPQKASAATP